MTDPQAAPLPIGDLNFFDNKLPSLFGGNYWVTVSHSAADSGGPVNTDPIPSAVQEFVVSAPQYQLPAGEIVSMHPAPATSGPFGENLPHVVLREPVLPWERKIGDGSEPVKPWLALLVLTEDEILGGLSSPTRTSSLSIGAFRTGETGIYKPTPSLEADVDPTATCNFIELPVGTFTSVMPRLTELPFLAHCRQAHIGDKAAQGLDPDGFFSIVLANRFPAAPPAGTAAIKNIVHLVSVEGLEALLVADPDFKGCTSVALVSLASWTFQCQSDFPLDFRNLAINLRDSKSLALTLPPPPAAVSPSGADSEVASRLSHGFVPLAYQTRTGESSFAWYRGPLVPKITQPLDRSAAGPFLTADSAMAYQAEFGVFDLSLAAAWEAGRAAALADPMFGQRLLDFRRRAHRLTDQLHYQLESDSFSADQISSLSTDTSVEDEFILKLKADMVASVGSTATSRIGPTVLRQAAAAPADPKDAVQAFLATPGVDTLIADLVSDDLAAIGQWLARLLLLYPLPFNLLVPDSAMAPPESLRFFYVDNNWTNALLDGALSLGLESSRHTFFHTTTRDLLQKAAEEAAQDMRAAITGADPPAAEASANVITGVLIRSALVSGWPTLTVRPWLSGTDMLRILRMDRLSPTTLLCLFWGVPTTIEISEPQEGLQLGVDQDGFATLRNITGSGPTFGAQTSLLQVYEPDKTKEMEEKNPFCARAIGDRTLDIGKLVATLGAKLTPAGQPPVSLTPAQFALQMIKAPEAIRFNTASS